MPKMKCEKRMKTFMSRVAISVALAAVAIVVRWKGCTQQPADDLVVRRDGWPDLREAARSAPSALAPAHERRRGTGSADASGGGGRPRAADSLVTSAMR